MGQAIKKAIEGGYKISGYGGPVVSDFYRNGQITKEFVLLDPLFWQSLGKAMGWDGNGEDFLRRYMGVNEQLMFRWQYEWHCFIDHLIAGKDADSFFTALLDTKGNI